MNPDRDALLEALLFGDLSPDEAVALEALADPTFRAELEDLKALQDGLEDLGSGFADEAPEAAEGEARDLARRLCAQARVRSTSLSMFGLTANAWGAAAAVLLMFVGWRVWSNPVPAGRGHEVILGRGLTLLEPLAQGASFGHFHWSLPGGPGYRFELEVFDAETDQSLYRKGGLSTSDHTPPATEAARWPEHIRWRVTGRDPGGHLVSKEAYASRSASD